MPVAKLLLILFLILPNEILKWFIVLYFLLFGMDTKKSQKKKMVLLPHDRVLKCTVLCIFLLSKIVVWLKMIIVCVWQTKTWIRNCALQVWHDITWSYYKLICIRTFFLRLLLPYERHIKGEHDKPLPLTKPRKQEGVQEKASGAKAKGVGAKKLKGPNNPKPESKKERGETVKGQEQSQVSQTSPNCRVVRIPSLNSISFWSLFTLADASPPVLNSCCLWNSQISECLISFTLRNNCNNYHFLAHRTPRGKRRIMTCPQP